MTDYKKAVLMIILGGICLSTLGIGTRMMQTAEGLQIVFYRAVGLAIFSTCCLAWSYKGNIFLAFKESGWVGFVAGLFFSIASVTVVLALIHTTVANAMFVISLAPLFTAVFAWLILAERVTLHTSIAIFVAILGVAIIVSGALSTQGMVGIVYAFLMAIFYALFNVSLRVGKDVNMIPAMCWSSYTLIIFLGLYLPSLSVPLHDIAIALSLGFFQIGLGAILLIAGSKHVPAAQLALLAMLEVVFSPVWVWIGVGETPSIQTMLGGIIIMLAVAYQAITSETNKRTEALP